MCVQLCETAPGLAHSTHSRQRNTTCLQQPRGSRGECASLTVAVPWGRGSRPTLRLPADSKCPALNSGTALLGHTVLLGAEAPLCSEGRRQERPGSSSRTFWSACCSCSPEGSSARGRHSTRPAGEEETTDPEWRTRHEAEADLQSFQ